MYKKYFGYDLDEILPYIKVLIMQPDSLIKISPINAEIINIDEKCKALINLENNTEEFELNLEKNAFLKYKNNKLTSLFVLINISDNANSINNGYYNILCAFEKTLKKSQNIIDISIVELFIKTYNIKSRKNMKNFLKKAYFYLDNLDDEITDDNKNLSCILESKNWTDKNVD